MGNSYIAKQRAVFATEIANTTAHGLICAMMVTEDANNPVPVLESLQNRTLMVRSQGQQKTLTQMIEGGFYGPYNRGQYPHTLVELRASPALQNRMNAAIATVMGGSDVIAGHTDQGLPTDPGGHYEMAHSHVMINGEVFGDWGGGAGYVANAAWRVMFEAGANKALQTALNSLGANPQIAVDGDIGPETVAAIKAFQKTNKLTVDGIPGPQTWDAIAKLETNVMNIDSDVAD
jgi:hypothetical protein